MLSAVPPLSAAAGPRSDAAGQMLSAVQLQELLSCCCGSWESRRVFQAAHHLLKLPGEEELSSALLPLLVQ